MIKENVVKRYTDLANPIGAYQDKDCVMGYDDICIAEAMIDIVKWFGDGVNPGMDCHNMNASMKAIIDAYRIDEMNWNTTADFGYMRSLDIDSLWMSEEGLKEFDEYVMTHTNLMKECVRRERKTK